MFEKRIKGHQNLNQSCINYSNDVHCTGIVVISYTAITLKKLLFAVYCQSCDSGTINNLPL